MKYQGKSMMSLNEMARLVIDYEGDGYVTGYPIVSGDDTYILNGVIEANEEYITINQWVPVFPESLKPVSPQLNENQKDLVLWMQENECLTDDPLELISDLFLEGTPSEYFPDLPLSCVAAAYQSLSKKQKLELVQEYVKKALEKEEE